MEESEAGMATEAEARQELEPKTLSHPWLIVVVAQQRSGTTAFGRTLNQGRKIKSFGEIFHNAGATSKVNYFNHRENRLKSEPWLSFSTPVNQEELWKSYVALLTSKSEKPFVLVDVKYNSWHHFNGVWYWTGEAPAMVHLVRKGRAKIVHIIRRNLFSQACSAILAEQRQQFHFTQTPESEPNSLILNPQGVLARMRRSQFQTRQFRKFFSGYEHCCELFYEDMFVANHLTAATQKRVSGLLGEDCQGGSEAPLVRATPPLSEIIENSREMVDFFHETPFGDMVADVLEGDSCRSA